jgi:hypothetical protein
MTIEELMAVWQTQDGAPLHGLNENLLRLALRQNESKRQKWRRIERWIIYVLSAGVIGGLMLFLANMILLMIYRDGVDGRTGWDLVFPVVGVAAALICARAVYVGHQAQARREQRFGESLRDQLNRSIAQLDYQATTLHRTLLLVLVLLTGICPVAALFALSRLNEKPFSDDGYMVVWLSFMCVFGVATGVWSIRQQTRDVVLPHKSRLEALLKELDGE